MEQHPEPHEDPQTQDAEDEPAGPSRFGVVISGLVIVFPLAHWYWPDIFILKLAAMFLTMLIGSFVLQGMGSMLENQSSQFTLHFGSLVLFTSAGLVAALFYGWWGILATLGLQFVWNLLWIAVARF